MRLFADATSEIPVLFPVRVLACTVTFAFVAAMPMPLNPLIVKPPT